MICKWCGMETKNSQVCDWCKRHPLGENPALTLKREAELARRERDALVKSLTKRIDQMLDEFASDGLLTYDEEAQIMALVQQYNLTPQELSPVLPKWNRLQAIRSVLSGQLPQLVGNVPILLKPGEVCHWVTSATLFEERTRRVSYGTSSGTSIRMTKGGSWYFGGSYRTSFPVYEMAELDSGTFVITSKRLAFLGSRRTLEKPLKNVVSVQLYSDAIQIYFSNRQKAPLFATSDAELVAAVIYQAWQFV